MWVKSWLLNRKCKGPFKNVLYDCPCKQGTLSTVHTYSTCEWITATSEVDLVPITVTSKAHEVAVNVFR